MNIPVKTLAISHNFNLEGASLSMYELITGLSENELIHPVVMSFEDGPLADRYKNSGIHTCELPFPKEWLRNARKILDAVDVLTNMIQEEGFGLVYGNTFLAFPLIHAAHKAEVPSMWNIRESQDMPFWQDYLGDRLELALNAFAHTQVVIFVSLATRDLWSERLPVADWRVVHNAFNSVAFNARRCGLGKEAWRKQHGIDQDSTVFLCVGTLHERKGQFDLIHAVTDMLIEENKVAVVCLGDSGGAYSQAIHEYLERLPHLIRKKIHIIPKTYYVADAYSAADVFVCCSRNESYPRIILEAMSVGLPILSTPVFGINEQVLFNQTALSYDAGDWQALKEAMLLLHHNQDQRRMMGGRGRERLASLISPNEVVARYGEIIGSLCRNKTVQ